MLPKTCALAMLCLVASGCHESRQVRFESEPPGAEVALENTHLGTTPVSTTINFPKGGGKDAARLQAVRMEMPGCEPVTRFISLQDVPLPEEENLITWSLPRLYTAMDVHVETRPPGAEVFVDGEPYGERTPCRVERTLVRSDRFAEFPTTTIAAMLDGYRNAEVTVDPHDLPSDGVTTITINLIPQ